MANRRMRIIGKLTFCGTYVALVAGFSTSTLLAQQTADNPPIPAPHRPVAPELHSSQKKTMSAVSRSMVGGLWMTDPNFRSVLTVTNNVQTSALTVTPVVYLSNGNKYQLTAVTLPPSGTANVDINGGLAAQGLASWASLYGYVEVQYSWPWDALCVTVTNLDAVHSEVFSYGLRPSGPMQAPKNSTALVTTTYEGLWWKQESNVTGFLTVSNLTAQPSTVSVQVTDRDANAIATHSVTVPPNGTKWVDLDELKPATTTDGGIHVTWTGAAADIVVNGGLQDQANGYSARIPFTQMLPLPQASRFSQRYAAVGLMTGAADAMMDFPAGTIFSPYEVLRNVSDRPISITPKVFWMQAGAAKAAALPSLTIAPNASYNLATASLLQSAGLQTFNGNLNLILDFQGPRYGLLAASGSVDQKNTYVFEVALAAVKESTSKSLSYWSTANGDDTMLTIWNPADEAQNFVVTFSYVGGTYDLSLHLEAKATSSLNLSQIIASQLPDDRGNTIPASVHEGSATIAGAHGDSEHILLAMATGTYNVQKAVCRTICVNCNGTSFSYINGDPIPVPVGATASAQFILHYNNGKLFDDTANATWASGNAAIAITGRGVVTSLSSGIANVTAQDGSAPVYAPTVCTNGDLPECPDPGVQAQAPAVALDDSGVAEVESYASGAPYPTGAQIKLSQVNWDAAIIAAIAAGYSQKPVNFPLYLNVSGDCYTVGATTPIPTTSVQRYRTYRLLDNGGVNPWPSASPVSITEIVTQTSGTHPITAGSSWALSNSSQFTDSLTTGGFAGLSDTSPVGAIQQFYAVLQSGPLANQKLALIVLDALTTKPGKYGTLGVYYKSTGVSINGDQQNGIPVCTQVP